MMIQGKEFEVLFTADTIKTRTGELAEAVMEQLDISKTEFIVVMNGAFVFAADLLRYFPEAVSVRFIQAASYHGMEQANLVDLYFRDSLEFHDKHVVIIEDIVDSGNTLQAIVREIKGYLSLSVVTLLFKEASYQLEDPPRFIGFKIPSVFVVGCGLDLDGWGRNLDSIYGLSAGSHAK